VTIHAPDLPLSGMRVIDLTQVMLGPCCTQLLGDFGADVIKVERAGFGDLARHTLPDRDGLENPLFLSINRNKRSVELDLKDPSDREFLLDLVRGADVVVSNFRPGVMERLGLGYDDLLQVNPALIYSSATGFGVHGPHVGKGGQDGIAQAMSGVMARAAGDGPPVIYPTAMADYAAGMHLAQGILLAFVHRLRTGVGQRVDVSLHDTMLHAQMQEVGMLTMRGTELNWSDRPLSGAFATSDSAVVLVPAFKGNALRLVCRALQIPDLSLDATLDTEQKQFASRARLQAVLREVFATNTTTHWIERLEGEDLLCAPVRSLTEALADPQVEANQMMVEFDHPVAGTCHTVAAPIHLSRTPASVLRPPPTLGQHTVELRSDPDSRSNLHPPGEPRAAARDDPRRPDPRHSGSAWVDERPYTPGRASAAPPSTDLDR
jgi:crotonobetainyl-CoA:carnitine CoA-transferase CaiB-like acyl-CoA transferase